MGDDDNDVLSWAKGLKTPSPTASPYDNFIEDSARRHNVDPDLIRAQMGQESSGKVKALSPKGASGLMQLMPETARSLGVKNIYDPKENIEGGTKYLRQQLDTFGGNVDLALAAYNAGPGAVKKYGNKVPPYKETRDYVSKIRSRYQGNGEHPQNQIDTNAIWSNVDQVLGQQEPPKSDVWDAVDNAIGTPRPENGKPLMAPPTTPTVAAQMPSALAPQTTQVAEAPINVSAPEQPSLPLAEGQVQYGDLTPTQGLALPKHPLTGKKAVRGAVQAPVGHQPTTSASLNPKDFTVDGEKVVDLAKAQAEQDIGTAQFPREVGKRTDTMQRGKDGYLHPTDELDRIAGEFTPIDAKSNEDASIQAVTAVARRYDVTPQQINEYFSLRRQAGTPALSGAFTKGKTIQVPYSVIAEMKGEKATKADIRTEQAQVAPGLVTPADLHVGKNFVKEDAESLRQMVGDKAATGLAAFLGIGGKTSTMLAGAVRELDAATIGDPEKHSDSIYHFLKEAGEATQKLVEESGKKELTYDKDGRPVIADDLASTIEKKGIEIVGDLMRLYTVGKVLGTPATTLGKVAHGAALFGGLSGLETAGRGASQAEVARQTAKGIGVGALFGVAGSVGNQATKVVGTLANKAIPEVFTEGATLGTIVGGTYGIAKLAGDKDSDAIQEGIVNGLFHVVPLVLGKTVGFAGSKLKTKVDDKGVVTVAPQDAKPDVIVQKDGSIEPIPKPNEPLPTKESEMDFRDSHKTPPKPPTPEITKPDVELPKVPINELTKLPDYTAPVETEFERKKAESLKKMTEPMRPGPKVDKAEAPKVTQESAKDTKAQPTPEEATAAKTVTEQAPPQGETGAVGGEKGRVVTVGEKQITLTPEQQTRWEKEVDVPLAAAKQARERDIAAGTHRIGTSGSGRATSEADKAYKGESMRIAAIKREITGELTGLERQKIAKREASNYIGKPVSVDGRNAEVVSNPFGRTKVKFEDGSTIVVDSKKIQARAVEPPVETKVEPKPTAPEVKSVEPKAVEPPKHGSFTKESSSASAERLRKKFGGTQKTFGTLGGALEELDAETIKDIREIAGYHLKQGVKTITELADKVAKEVGDWVRPHIEKLYPALAEKTGEPPPKKPIALKEPKGEPTSIMQEEIQTDRENRGWDRLSKKVKQSNPDLHAEVQGIIAKDPEAPLKTFEKFKANPKAAPTKVEDVLLNAHLVNMKGDAETAHRNYVEAMDSGDPLKLSDAEMDRKIADSKLDEAQQVAFRSGSESGAALQARKMFADDDFEYTRLVREYKIAKGREPSGQELKALQQLADEHKAKSEALETALAGKDEEIASIKAQMPPRHILDIAENYVNKLHGLADKERARLAAKGNVFQAGVDPRDLKSAAIIGADHLATMSLDFAKWSKRMTDEFGDAIEPHLEKIFGEAQKILKGGHSALKSDADKMGTALKAQKTRMSNRITALENAIAKRERITRTRTSLTPDAELTKLREQAKSLKEDYDAIFPKEPRAPMTDAQRLTALEKRLEKKQQTIAEKVKNQDLTEIPKRLPVDPYAIKQDTSGKYTKEDRATATRIIAAQAEVGKIEKRYAAMKQQAERASEPMTKWALRKAVNYVRGSMLSAVTVIEKLGAASLGRTITRPIKTAIGYPVSKLLPGIARKAAIEGSKGLWNDIGNEAHAFAKAWTTGVMDMGRVISGKGADITQAYGPNEQHLTKGRYLPFETSQLVGLMHDSLKSPAFRGEYEGVLGNLILDAKRNGQTIDNETMWVLGQRAYNYALRAKFMEKRWASTELQNVFRKLDNGESTPAQALGAALHILIPIHRISTNVIAQSLESSPLGLAKGIGKAVTAKSRGLDNLSPEQADIIIRNIKHGLFGSAMYALGLFAGGKAIGSFYQKYDKDKDKEVAKYNTVQIDGTRVPSALLHLPEFNAMFMGATTKRIYEETKKKPQTSTAEAAFRGAGGGVGGLIEDVPGVEAAESLTNIYHAIMGGDTQDMNEARYGLGNFVSGRAVPGIVRNAAEAGDQDPQGHFTFPFMREPYHRKVNIKTFGSSIKTQTQKNIPWWRNKLPNDTPR